MLSLTATFETAATFQSGLSLTDLIFLWYLLMLLDNDAERSKKRHVRQKRTHDAQRAQEEKRRKRQLPFRPGF